MREERNEEIEWPMSKRGAKLGAVRLSSRKPGSFAVGGKSHWWTLSLAGGLLKGRKGQRVYLFLFKVQLRWRLRSSRMEGELSQWCKLTWQRKYFSGAFLYLPVPWCPQKRENCKRRKSGTCLTLTFQCICQVVGLPLHSFWELPWSFWLARCGNRMLD